MFKPISLHDAPLKEGRLPLAIPSTKELSAKRAQRIRQIVLAVLVLLLLRTMSVLYWSPSSDLSARGPETTSTLGPSVPPSRPPTPTPRQDAKAFPKLNLDGSEAAEADAPGLSLEGAGRGAGQVPLGGHRAKTGSKAVKFSPRPDFEKALLRIVNLLPSELEMRGLLRPIELTGEQRLRELGMLARKYKKYLEAWEQLHVVTDAEGSDHVRDDVVQYLRYQASAAAAAAAATTDDDDDDDRGDEHEDLVGRIHAYEDFRRLLVQLNELLFPFTAPYFPDHMTLRSQLKKGGRGLVLTAGNDQVAYLLTQIPILRQLGCDLPIEVMYVGDHDLNRDSRQDLEDLEGVVTRDIAAMVHPAGWDIGSWAAKPFAILLSSFREAIFIDADSFFFVNPEVMFDYPEYVKTGALFFRDRLIMPENKKSWLQSILPQPVSRNVKQSRLWTGESGHQQESGVMVVDTYRHFLAMLFVTRMNGPDRDGDKQNGKIGVYDMVYGDKETFWLGFELVGDTDYVFHQGDAGIIGVLEPEMPPEPARNPFAKRQELGGGGEALDDPSDEGEEEEEEEASTPTPTPTSSAVDPVLAGRSKHKICSPQLLHLDLQGRPLWFNGGLVRNKFVDRREWKFGEWDSYMAEPRDVREPGAWLLGEANMCCLTSDAHLKAALSPRDKALMDDMVKQAKKVGIAN